MVASGQDSHAADPVATDAVAPKSVELTIRMPCLNEAETIVACVRKAREFLRASDIVGEVLIPDNGSTAGSKQLAAREGARVLLVSIVVASLNFTLMKFWAFAERA